MSEEKREQIRLFIALMRRQNISVTDILKVIYENSDRNISKDIEEIKEILLNKPY